MVNFDCYRNYSLAHHGAHGFHATLLKSNNNYRKFLEMALSDRRCEDRQLLDFLVEPPQRITRYILLMKGK